jgi:hypothetical protein
MRLLVLLALLAAPSRAQEEDHSGHHDHGDNRQASGTAWQPAITPHDGPMFAIWGWDAMTHGYVNGIYDHQGGRRGSSMWLSQSMLMLMAERPLGEGKLSFRNMLSLEPLMRKSGYPLLFQAGETADGRTPLIDRQHPHDFFMELAGRYDHPVGEEGSAFLYMGYPGEPALGPAAFMHRYSAVENPEAPLGHHWLDSSHIVFGVLTGGYIWRDVKAEVSGFKGREPNQDRWDFDHPDLDSFSGRLTYNPTESWSMQVSYGKLHEPEQTHGGHDTDRVTASVTWGKEFAAGHWQTTAAWGNNKEGHGRGQNSFLLESSINPVPVHTVFGRWESLERSDLFVAGQNEAGRTVTVHKLNVGYVHEFWGRGKTTVGAGFSAALHFVPRSLRDDYGTLPASVMLFLRARLGA